MRPLALVLAAVVCSAACGGTTVLVVQSPPASPATGSTPGVVVTADVLRVGATVAVPLAPEQAIAHGDQVALDVDLDRDAYVYVLYVDASGTINSLFPRTGDTRLATGRQHLPALGRRWKADDLRGKECFVVLASSAPLDEAIRRSRAAALKPSAQPAAIKVHTRRSVAPRTECPETSRGPETTDAMRRPHCRGPTEVADEILGTPDASGVVTALFWVDHRGR